MSSAKSQADVMNAKLQAAIADRRARSHKALKIEAFNILTRSRTEFVPLNSGDLVSDSGATVDETDDSITITLWYGAGVAKDYAAAVHETPSEHDPPSWKGKPVNFNHGQSKYLERPLLDAVDGMAGRIAEATK